MTLERTAVEQLLPAYEIEGELGRGAWGIVFAARHRHLGRQVAVKQLPRAFGADPEAKHRFVTEARLLATLDHPHIVPVYDYAEDGGLCLLVMERLSGGTLWARWSSQGLDAPAAVATVLAVCAGLQHAHTAGVLHRDIKPENILYAASGRPKLADFGIAKVLGGGQAGATRAGDVLGTPAYIAPEQAQGRPLGPGTDVYATAVVLFELLAGRLPFSEDGDAMALLWRHVYEPPTPLTDIAPHVPAAVANVVMGALAKDAADRPSSAEAFAVQLADAASGAWGTGWLDTAGIPLDLSSSVQRASRRGDAAAPASPVPTSAPSALPPPVARSASTVITPSVPPPTGAPAAPLPPPVVTTTPATPSVVVRADRLASHAAGVARSAGRPHLARLLDTIDAASSGTDAGTTVLLGGTPHSGKSTLATAAQQTLPAGATLHFLEVGDGGAAMQRAVLRGFAPTVHGVVLAIRSGRAIEPDDRDTLAAVAGARVPIALCATKSDLYPTALTQSLLLEAVRSVPGVRFHAVAADLALAAPTDPDLRRESGLTQLHTTFERELLRPRAAHVLVEAAGWVALVAARMAAAPGGTGESADAVLAATGPSLDQVLHDGATALREVVARHASTLQRAVDDHAWRAAAAMALRDVAEQIGAMVSSCGDALAHARTMLWRSWWTGGDIDIDTGNELFDGDAARLTRAVLPTAVAQLAGFADQLTRPWELPGVGPTHSATAADARSTTGRQRSTDVLTRLPALGDELCTSVVAELRAAAERAARDTVELAELLALDAAGLVSAPDATTSAAATSLLDAALAVRGR